MIIDCVARGRRQEEGVKWAEILFGWFVFRFFVTARGLGVARRGAALLAPVKKKGAYLASISSTSLSSKSYGSGKIRYNRSSLQ